MYLLTEFAKKKPPPEITANPTKSMGLKERGGGFIDMLKIEDAAFIVLVELKERRARARTSRQTFGNLTIVIDCREFLTNKPNTWIN